MPDSLPSTPKQSADLNAPVKDWTDKLPRWLRKQYLLSLYPHPDSFVYPTRKRIYIVTITLMLGHLGFGYYWHLYFPNQPQFWLELGIAVLAFLLFLKVRLGWRPDITNSGLYAILLWIGMPLFVSIDYLLRGGGHPVLEHVCLMFLLYVNLLHWRVGSVGLILALGTAFICKWLLFPAAPMPNNKEWIFIAVSALLGLLHSFSFTLVDSKRHAHAERILRVVNQQLQEPLGIQLALSEALRFEAANTSNTRMQNNLFELAQKLDMRANLTRAELEEMQHQSAQLQRLGSTQLIQAKALLEPVLKEMQSAYGWNRHALVAHISSDMAEDAWLQAEWTEVVQMLGSVIAVMLRPGLATLEQRAPILDDSARVHLSCYQHNNQCIMNLAHVASRPNSLEASSSNPPKHSDGTLRKSAKSHHEAASRILPAYAMYVLERIQARIYLDGVSKTAPSSIKIVFPPPDVRLDNRKRLMSTLMQMYGLDEE